MEWESAGPPPHSPPCSHFNKKDPDLYGVCVCVLSSVVDQTSGLLQASRKVYCYWAASPDIV